MVKDTVRSLESVISRDIDDDIKQTYASLKTRSEALVFGLFDEDVVVVDTETTGLDFKDCELIEVAAARLRGNTIVETFDHLVHPARPIPAEIEQITGITNDMVAHAESGASIARKFCDFARDTPLVAHNCTFDRHFLEKANGGERVGQPWIDSLELSRIVLPALSTHKLQDLSAAFGLHQSTHRALDDVLATCELWRILLTAATDMPPGLAWRLAQMYPDVSWSYRPIFAQAAAMTGRAAFSLADIRDERCAHLEFRPRRDARDIEEEGPPVKINIDELAGEFSEDGLMGAIYPGFERRDEQAQMACFVAQVMNQSRLAAVEAGTGVGKSMAYLLAAARFAQANTICVGIATKTNNLTDQLINRELPALAAQLPVPLHYAALKGFDNYPCLRKISALMQAGLRTHDTADAHDSDDAAQGPEACEDLLNAIAASLNLASQSAYGDINYLGIRWGKINKSDLTTTAGQCHKQRCPFFPHRCFLHLARRRAAASDIVVTNHSLLFRQVGSDLEVLPDIRYWIVDEAHGCEAEARKQWALTINSAQTTAILERTGTSSSGLLGTLMRSVASRPHTDLAQSLLLQAANEVIRVGLAADMFFGALRRFCKAHIPKSAYDTQTRWIDAEMRSQSQWRALEEPAQAFSSILERAIASLYAALTTVTESVAADFSLGGVLSELSGLTKDLETTQEALSVIMQGTDKQYVYSAALARVAGTQVYELSAEEIDVGAKLAHIWYPQISSVLYTSATLSIADSFDHFARSVGLNRAEDGYLKLCLQPGYDYTSNMGIFVIRDMPDPNQQKTESLDALAELLSDVHLAMQGSVLTLFTNRSEMETLFERVAPVLARSGLELSCQNRKSSVKALRDHFISEAKSSLFALKSFWEGFDAQGDTLRCVVIPRLPFTPPTDPLSQQRRLQEGSASWRNHDLPESVLGFKQGVGRLLRSASDKGVLILADPRLVQKAYGKVFLRSLPSEHYQICDRSTLADKVRIWRDEHGC